MLVYSKLKSRLFPAALVVIAVAVCLLNYTPGTWLSGWDTLHPEFNLGLYLGRIFWGVWQQHQGLGAVAAQAHASELGRLWYLLPASLLPADLFRYGYFWLALILGPLGTFFLLRRAASEEAAFVGGLFYLLNLGTMQHFYLPLEMFVTAYAFLPWLFWAVYQKKGSALALVFFIAAPMAHTPTLFIVNFAALSLFAFLVERRWGVKVFLIGLLVNSFWLLPTAYFVLNHGLDVAASHISEQFSIRAILVNKEFGTLADVALLRGYFFDWGHFDFGSRRFVDLFPIWKAHLGNLAILVSGYLAFGLVVVGAVKSFIQKSVLGRAMTPVMLVAFLGMLTVFDVLGGFNPILAEAFRFPFTKFSLLLMLCFAVFIGLALDRLKKVWLLVAVGLVVYMWPVFSGNLICRCERVQFPTQYQELYQWFAKEDPDSRIAPVPINSIYGWSYYDWGYEGAGFRWFGLSQPILDREFDRWMPQNEGFYWEMSYALYSKNLPLLEAVFDKYRVSWLLLDESIINPPSPKALFGDEFKQLVAQSKQIKVAARFGKLTVYKVLAARPTQKFVSVGIGLPGVSPGYKWGNLDRAFFDLGDYTAGDNVIYLNRSLFSGKKQEDLEFDPKKLVNGQSSPAGETKTWSDGRQCQSVGTQGQEGCITIDFPTLVHKQGYLITVESRNELGQPLLFFIENVNNRTTDLETYLPKKAQMTTSYFVQPPMETDGVGYTLHFDLVSFGKEKSINRVGKVTVTPIDYWGLVGQRTGTTAGTTKYLPVESYQVSHPNPSFYRVDLPGNTLSKDTTLLLSQSYDHGWVAVAVSRNQQVSRLGDHVLIDNWANGWKLSGDEQIVYLFFWPQLLEFAGFGLLTITIFGAIIAWIKSFLR
ncbi:hypothetical protein HY440_03145 [Candidatus Microgenomates bacterium]|nr:hypothetical protein [Candidatus Microgenomates bacterium]